MKHQIAEYIRKGLKDELIEFISSNGFAVPLHPKTEDARKIAVGIIAQGLAEDIHNSRYQIRESCTDESGIEKEGTATGVRGSPICYSVEKILQNWYDPNPKISWTELEERLLALAIHEHSHHYEYKDRDHAVYGFALERASAYIEGYDHIGSVKVSPEFSSVREAFFTCSSFTHSRRYHSLAL